MILNMLFHLDHYIKYIFNYFLNVSLKGVHICFPNHILIHHINKLKNKNDNREHPCLAPDLKGKAFSFSQLNIILIVVLSYMTFIMLRYIPPLLTFGYFFMTNGC